MTTPRQAMLAALDMARKAMGSTGADLRPHTVTVRTVTWSGNRIGSGTPSAPTDLAIAPVPRVRQVSEQEILSSNGRFQRGDYMVGPVTPQYPQVGVIAAGGYTVAQLEVQQTANGIDKYYLLGGPDAGDFALIQLRIDSPLGYYAVIRRRRTTPVRP